MLLRRHTHGEPAGSGQPDGRRRTRLIAACAVAVTLSLAIAGVSATVYGRVHRQPAKKAGTATSLNATQTSPPATGAFPASGASPTAATEPLAATTVGPIKDLGTVDATATSSYHGQNWASADVVNYYKDASGNLAIVRYHASNTSLTIETVNPVTLQQVGDTRTISLSGWPDWGGFYAGSDNAFYVLVGRDNPNESDSLDVVALRRYDANWSLVGTAYVKGGASQGVKGIYHPFEASAADMALTGQRLVVHMGRLIYAEADVHHQANMTFEVDTATMTAKTFADLGGDGAYAYSSHSFRQLVAMNGSNLVTVDHGDAYPRAIQLGVAVNYPTRRKFATYQIFPFNGNVGDNFTGATVNAMVSGPSGVVVLGSSIRQPNAPKGTLGSSSERRNVYAIAANPATGAHTLSWLTSFAPTGGDNALEPRAVAVGDDAYAVLFSVKHGTGYDTEYRLIDSTGSVRASATFSGMYFAPMSDPILIDGAVYWTGTKSDSSARQQTGYLFGIDVSTPSAPKALNRPAAN